MTRLGVVAWLLLLPSASVAEDATAWESAASEFEAGVELRADATAARPHFAAAARGFDDWWNAGNRNPAVAANRAKAYFLAGDLPRGLVAVHEGLALFPWDADLQRTLAELRANVAYPNEPEPAERTRPDPPGGLRSRVSPGDLLLFAIAATIAVAAGITRRITTRDAWSIPVTILGIAGILGVAWMSWTISREETTALETPVAVVSEDTILRRGNAFSHPARLAFPLAAGTEIRILGDRGGWVQVQIPGGAIGWLPTSTLHRLRILAAYGE